jgi:hypothetical protein
VTAHRPAHRQAPHVERVGHGGPTPALPYGNVTCFANLLIANARTTTTAGPGGAAAGGDDGGGGAVHACTIRFEHAEISQGGSSPGGWWLTQPGNASAPLVNCSGVGLVTHWPLAANAY